MVWKIADLNSINEDDTLAPIISGVDLHIDPKDLEGLRPSYRFLAYARIKAGDSVSDDLLGIDRSEEIAQVYRELQDWIHD